MRLTFGIIREVEPSCQGGHNGQVTCHGRTVAVDRATHSQSPAQPQGRAAAGGRSRLSDRHSLRAQNRHPLGRLPPRDGLLRHAPLEPPARLAQSRRLAKTPRIASGQTPSRGTNRLLACDCGLLVRACGAWRKKTGKSPVDRRKRGSKHHLVVDAGGVPLATTLTAANRHDVTQLIPLTEATPPTAAQRGAPWPKPEEVMGDRGYDSDAHRMQLSGRNIPTAIARRRTPHGSGLGIFRYVVEQTIALLHQFRRLRTRFDKRDDIHEAFMSLGCSVICWRRYNHGYF